MGFPQGHEALAYTAIVVYGALILLQLAGLACLAYLIVVQEIL